MQTFFIFQNSLTDGFQSVVIALTQMQAAKITAASLIGQGYEGVEVQDDAVFFRAWWHKDTSENSSNRRLYSSEESFKELNPSCEAVWGTQYYNISTTEGWVLASATK